MREIVLVDCPDAVGLIHRITGVLEHRRLNIEANHEFVDAATGHFFFRAEVVAADGRLSSCQRRSRPCSPPERGCGSPATSGGRSWSA